MNLKLPVQSLLVCGVVSINTLTLLSTNGNSYVFCIWNLVLITGYLTLSTPSSAPLNHHVTFFYEFGFFGRLIWRELQYLSFWWLAYFKYCNSFKVQLCCSRHQHLLFLKLNNCLSYALYGCGPSCFPSISSWILGFLSPRGCHEYCC